MKKIIIGLVACLFTQNMQATLELNTLASVLIANDKRAFTINQATVYYISADRR